MQTIERLSEVREKTRLNCISEFIRPTYNQLGSSELIPSKAEPRSETKSRRILLIVTWAIRPGHGWLGFGDEVVKRCLSGDPSIVVF